MQTETPNSSQSFTILRIKRKRNEEPLDALVVESRVRRKKSRGGMGVFQYAQTVEDDEWKDERRQKDIQDKISRLAREDEVKAGLKANIPATQPDTSPTISRQSKDDISRNYTIIEQPDSAAPSSCPPTSPPKVVSARELEKAAVHPDFKMYDAIPVPTTKPPTQQDSEMDKFLPMLDAYLKIHHVDDDIELKPPASTPKSSAKSTKPVPLTSNADDYVWDVFYHRPATLSEWNEIANNVGTLTGLPPGFGDYDSASDSDEELDEADEDSNAEEYYKNDYPDEESGSSDEFHEDSDYDDMMHYQGETEDS